jgi:hypothetical protein
VSGSIDDLKPKSAADVSQLPVAISGVLLDATGRKAMLTVGGGAPTWNAVGADVGGWHVASIDADGAVIERDGESVALKIADRYKLRTKGKATPSPEQPGPDSNDKPPDEGAGLDKVEQQPANP